MVLRREENVEGGSGPKVVVANDRLDPRSSQGHRIYFTVRTSRSVAMMKWSGCRTMERKVCDHGECGESGRDVEGEEEEQIKNVQKFSGWSTERLQDERQLKEIRCDTVEFLQWREFRGSMMLTQNGRRYMKTLRR